MTVSASPVTVRLSLLTLLCAFGPLSTDMYIPSMAGMVRIFGTDVASVQLTLSVYLVGFAAAQLIYGPLSDRYGRRPVVLSGTVLFTLASFGCAFANDIHTLIGARFLQALGAASGPVIGRAVVRDVFEGRRAAQALGRITGAVAIGPAIAPIIGGWLDYWFSWRATFVALAMIGIAAALFTLAALPETNRQRDPTATRVSGLLRNYGILLRSRVFLGFVLTATFAYSGIFGFLSSASFILIDVMGVATEKFGFFFVIMVSGYMSGAWTGSRLVMRWGIDRVIMGGLLLTACGATAGAIFTWSSPFGGWSFGPFWVIGPMAVCTFGIGCQMPNTMAGAAGPFPSIAGTASSLLGFIQMGVSALIGIGVAYAFDNSARPMATSLLFCALAGCLSFRLLVWRRAQ